MTLKRMDNILIVVEDMEAARAFFFELFMELEGDAHSKEALWTVWLGSRTFAARTRMLRTPAGHGLVGLSKFHTPAAIRVESQDAPSNTLGIRRIMFAVDDVALAHPRR